MFIKAQVIHELGTLSEAELVQAAEFLVFLKFRARLQPSPELDEAQLARCTSHVLKKIEHAQTQGWRGTCTGFAKRMPLTLG